ncbi:MAG: hypothetical protein IJ566_01915 [Cardiobacteriaceae bacterium]|nr:hypothetical protein [Cardiobacteriaceae bacterium]
MKKKVLSLLAGVFLFNSYSTAQNEFELILQAFQEFDNGATSQAGQQSGFCSTMYMFNDEEVCSNLDISIIETKYPELNKLLSDDAKNKLQIDLTIENFNMQFDKFDKQKRQEIKENIGKYKSAKHALKYKQSVFSHSENFLQIKIEFEDKNVLTGIKKAENKFIVYSIKQNKVLTLKDILLSEKELDKLLGGKTATAFRINSDGIVFICKEEKILIKFYELKNIVKDEFLVK